MKNIFLLFALLIQFSTQAQTIEPAPADKAVVYFVRASSMGSLINFTYFDSTKVIGKFNGPKFMRYECEPGSHLFWARSENRDFVQANLEAGKIYVIDVMPMMGALKAAVSLIPVNSSDYRMKRIQKILTKRSPETFTKKQLDYWQGQMKDVISRGLEKAQKLNGNFNQLEGYTLEPEQLKFVKKQRK